MLFALHFNKKAPTPTYVRLEARSTPEGRAQLAGPPLARTVGPQSRRPAAARRQGRQHPF